MVLENCPIRILLTSSDVRILLSSGVEHMGVVRIDVALPLGRRALVSVRSIEFDSVEFDKTEIVASSSIEFVVESNAFYLPSFKGELNIDWVIDLLINRGQLIRKNIRLANVQWQNYPLKLNTSKRIPFAKRILRRIVKNINKIEQSLENEIDRKIQQKDLSLTIPMSIWEQINSSSLEIANAKIYLGRLLLVNDRIELDFVISGHCWVDEHSKNHSSKIDFSVMASDHKSTLMYLSEADFNNVLSKHINLINEKVPTDLFKVQELNIGFFPESVFVSVLPETDLKLPVTAHLSLEYKKEKRKLILSDVEVASERDTSVIFRSLLGLFSGKIEQAVENYFPVKEEEMMAYLNDTASGVVAGSDLPFDFKISQIEDIQFMEKQVYLEVNCEIAISRNDGLSSSQS